MRHHRPRTETIISLKPRIVRLCLLLFTGSMFVGASVNAQEPVDPLSTRDTLTAYSEGLDGLRARFQQQVMSQDGQVVDQGSGEVWLQSPDQFRWYYEGDFPELIVADGQYVWIYDESLEQVTVREQGGAAGDSPLLLLTNPAGLDEDYQVTELGTLDGSQMLQLTARSADAPFESLMLTFTGGELRGLVLEDTFGLRTEMAFFEVERNPQLPDDHFRFTPPPGVDLLGDVPPGYVAD